MIINIPKSDIRFCLVGSGKPCVDFTRLLIKNGFAKPIIVTWNKTLHRRDQIILKDTKNYEDIFLFSSENNIEVIETDNVNNWSVIELLKKRRINIIFSIKSRWIIKDYFINEFNGLVLNIHQGDLPVERGSAIYQRIMNNNEIIGVTLHLVSSTVDGGNILYKKTQKVDSESPTIDLVNSINMKLSNEIFKDFISDLINGKEILEHKQDNEASIFMPQFFTETNGAIDWSWSAKEIECFIRAFGPPMPGAFTFYKGKRISLLKANIEKTNQKYHSYFNGRVVTLNNNGSMRIITKDDYLIVSNVKYGEFIGSPSKIIRMNSFAVLYTPMPILNKARTEFKHSLKMPPPFEEK